MQASDFVWCDASHGASAASSAQPRQAVIDAAAAAGLGPYLTPHDLRCSFASIAARRIPDPAEAAYMTGHSLDVWISPLRRSWRGCATCRRRAPARLLEGGFGTGSTSRSGHTRPRRRPATALPRSHFRLLRRQRENTKAPQMRCLLHRGAEYSNSGDCSPFGLETAKCSQMLLAANQRFRVQRDAPKCVRAKPVRAPYAYLQPIQPRGLRCSATSNSARVTARMSHAGCTAALV